MGEVVGSSKRQNSEGKRGLVLGLQSAKHPIDHSMNCSVAATADQNVDLVLLILFESLESKPLGVSGFVGHAYRNLVTHVPDRIDCGAYIGPACRFTV
jgi:hypothetical protein